MTHNIAIAGALVVVAYLALIWLIVSVVGFNARGCNQECGQGRENCDCSKRTDEGDHHA